jgi:hypothetical protein
MHALAFEIVSRSQVQQMPFRLPVDMMRRLDAIAEACGQTRQAFVQAAVMAEVAEAEDRLRLRKRTSDFLPPKPIANDDASDGKPAGLGFVQHMMKYHHQKEEPETNPAPQGQVVVNVGSSNVGAVGGDIIERLAAFVVTGQDFERSARLRTAVSILHASTSTDEERKVLAVRLDEAIASKTKSNASESKGIARMAFDKLSSLLK